MHWIKAMEFAGEYKLKLKFEDRKVKIVDLKNHLQGRIFQPLKDRSYFKKARLNKDLDTVVWPNHADFSPDFLYAIGSQTSPHHDD